MNGDSAFWDDVAADMQDPEYQRAFLEAYARVKGEWAGVEQ